MSLIAPDQLDDRPRPTITLTPGMYKLKRAYHIDPLMAAMVVIEQPSWRNRVTGEHDTVQIVKDMRGAGIQLAPPVRRKRKRKPSEW